MKKLRAVLLLLMLAFPSMAHAQSPLSQIKQVAISLTDLPQGFAFFDPPTCATSASMRLTQCSATYTRRTTGSAVMVTVSLLQSPHAAHTFLHWDWARNATTTTWHPVFIGQQSHASMSDDPSTVAGTSYYIDFWRDRFVVSIRASKVTTSQLAAWARLMDQRIMALRA